MRVACFTTAALQARRHFILLAFIVCCGWTRKVTSKHQQYKAVLKRALSLSKCAAVEKFSTHIADLTEPSAVSRVHISMQYTFLTFLLTAAFSLSAQPYSNLPLHEYESFHAEFRSEKIKTTLADYELTGPVKSVTSVYGTSPVQADRRTEQHFSFSEEGRLMFYSLNDTADTRQSEKPNQHAESHQLHYSQSGQLELRRVAEFYDGARTDLYLQSYDANGYLASARKPGRNGCLAPVVIHYVYTSYDSFVSVTTRPFSEYDITGNVIADSVHFVFDNSGRVISEQAFRFGSSEKIAFAWTDAHSFRYSILGRSYMEETGEWKYNAAGKPVRITSSGYHINQQGTDFYTRTDSLLYNEWGWISHVYRKSTERTPGSFNAIVFSPAPATAKSNVSDTLPKPKPQFVYTYIVDGRGNWTARHHYDGEGKLIAIETREIEYYLD